MAQQISDAELAARSFSVANAIATQRLAGVTLDPETIADLKSWARGEIELTIAHERALARIAAKIQRSR
ncbi:antitoxin VbhA family protein [Paraburkholderia caledonica]|uniref:antitoxin VbhA family protein n=1 Tax=Paraburkholderia caledonica TaxID=134536 RepID=UPI000B3FBB89|nr:antitoxin VbhA family protein [Paraburkholderia caledonica]